MIILSAVFLGGLFADTAMARRVGNRQVRQQGRIIQGVNSGELTAGEAIRLENQQLRIRRSKRNALSDGELTVKEKVKLEAQQDRASHRIYKLKHNDTTQ